VVKQTYLNRNINIDIIKGLLIFLVVIGHVLLGSLKENIIRYVIYSFHMPIFLFISGYLVNTKALKESSLVLLFKKYLFRLIIPWVIAVFVYSLIENRQDIFHNIFRIFYRPYYHLWYVPSILAFVFSVFFLMKIKIKIELVLILFIPLTYILNYIYVSPGVNKYIHSELISILSYLFRPQYYLYFVLGIFIKKHLNVIGSVRFRYLIIAGGIFLLLNIFLFYVNDNLNKKLTAFTFIVQNILFALFAIKFITGNSQYFVRKKIGVFISWLGRESLGVYLWHVLPILLVKHIIISNYYLFTTLSLIIFLIIIKLMDKYKFSRQYFLGKL